MSKLIKKIDSYIAEGFADDKKFDNDMQILRAAIRAELDAVTFYEQMSVKANDINIANLLLDVAREEKVHVGEFEEMLKMIDPEVKYTEEEGSEELKNDILIRRK